VKWSASTAASTLNSSIITRYNKKDMKKILTLCMLVLVSCLTVLGESNEDMMARARQRFQNMKTLTAPVTQTRHNALLTADEVSKGTFYFKKPSSMCLKFNSGKDMLLMKNQQSPWCATARSTRSAARATTSSRP
jgi:outer membrane lipoprotein-sorting protein